jgi:hypothetical protein
MLKPAQCLLRLSFSPISSAILQHVANQTTTTQSKQTGILDVQTHASVVGVDFAAAVGAAVDDCALVDRQDRHRNHSMTVVVDQCHQLLQIVNNHNNNVRKQFRTGVKRPRT